MAQSFRYRVTVDPGVSDFLAALSGQDRRADRKVMKAYRVLARISRKTLPADGPTVLIALTDPPATVHVLPDLDADEPRLEIALLVRGDRAHVFAAGSFEDEQGRQALRDYFGSLAPSALADLGQAEG
jgi:hypothetical protein